MITNKFTYQAFYNKATRKGYIIPFSLNEPVRDIAQKIEDERSGGNDLLLIQGERMRRVIIRLFVNNGYTISGIKSPCYSHQSTQQVLLNLATDRANLYQLLDMLRLGVENITFVKGRDRLTVHSGGYITGSSKEDIWDIVPVLYV